MQTENQARKKHRATLKIFDFAVANPPFSNKNWTNGINPQEDEFERFVWGIPPEKNGDYTFLLHILKSLKSTGKAAVILPHGVLFRGNAEARIRENLIKQGYIKGIIGLPANLFYGTGIPACIIVIDKENAHARKGIFMMDASKGFIKDGNKNRLRAQDIHKIVDVFTKQQNIARYSRMVSTSEVANNDYNLNIPRYIDSSDPEDLHDLSAHLQGGIPNKDIDALAAYWQIFPSLRNALFKPARVGYSNALVTANQVKNTILNHPEFVAFAALCRQPFATWSERVALHNIEQGQKPKQIISQISEQLLQAYANTPLLNAYDVYQILMDYWSELMQDDVYVLVQEGWLAAKILRDITADKDKKSKETPDLIIGKNKYKAELIPPTLIVNRYFAKEQAVINQLQSHLDSASQALESYVEEHSGEEGLLADALNDKDKVTVIISLKVRLKLATDKEEKNAVEHALSLFEAENMAKKKLKEAQDALDLAVFKQYSQLSEQDIKTLIVENKWLASLQAAIEAEIERVTQQLANRVKELEERYALALPSIEQEVEALSLKVATHLKAMGLAW